MKRLLLAFALVSAYAHPAAAPQAAEKATYSAGDPAENKAVRLVAMDFLQRIDSGHVDSTWSVVGDYLRGTTTRDEWEQGIVDARAGRDPASRDLMGALFTPELDDNRKGHFFIVVYVTRYGGDWFQERVILTRQGTDWKVDGYWMLPSDAKGNVKQG
jgi:hypothetical protein